MVGIASALWWWTRRLGYPPTPGATQRWRDELSRLPDGFRREMDALAHGELHDALLARRLTRAGTRFARSAARLPSPTTVLLESVHAVAENPAAPVSSRHRFVPVWAVPVTLAVVFASDLFVSSILVAIVGASLTEIEAQRITVLVTLGYLAAGKVIAAGLLHKRRLQTVGGTVATLTVSYTLARGVAAHASQWFVISLLPTLVAVVVTVLAHPDPADHERATRAHRRSMRRLARSRRRCEARFARASRTGARLCHLAAPGLVARTRAISSGEPLVFDTHDVTEALRRLGLGRHFEALDRANEALQMSHLRRADSGPGPNCGAWHETLHSSPNQCSPTRCSPDPPDTFAAPGGGGTHCAGHGRRRRCDVARRGRRQPTPITTAPSNARSTTPSTTS
ncbi:MAG: hypothetical protein R2715_03545 [Ilumatobacteraceae bacterium]